MRKAAIVVDSVYANNKLFDLSNKFLNRDDCLKSFYLLREELKHFDYDLCTHDIHNVDDSELIIFNEMPKDLSLIREGKSILLIFESDIIRPDNWNLNYHKKFSKIFTWNDDFVDNDKYFKMNFSNEFKFTKPNGKRSKLATLISGNKTSSHGKELYSERVKTIKWFEENQDKDFDYYGFGWDKYIFGSQTFGKILDKLGLYKVIPARKSKCYKGIVDSKHQTLQKYTFNICYENGKDITGYITEKVFDAFFAGCIPVYWGPDNIFEHIDESCIIDRRRFKSHQELYDFLMSMKNDEILNYQQNIYDFLNSKKGKCFDNSYFAKHIADKIING